MKKALAFISIVVASVCPGCVMEQQDYLEYIAEIDSDDGIDNTAGESVSGLAVTEGSNSVRSCSVRLDCQAGCDCYSGICAPYGGPTNPNCHLPPLDPFEYEGDDYYQSAVHYMGTPQQHTFHNSGDVDWGLVYFPSAGSAIFETTAVSGSPVANTYLEVYIYNLTTGAPEPLVAVNDNRCGYYWIPSCQMSRVMVPVPANSAYFFKVTSRDNSGAWNEDRYFDPTYTMTVSYQ